MTSGRATAIGVGLVVLAAGALALASASFSLPWHVIAGGGGRSSSASYALGATIGQPATGLLSGPGFRLNAGFWAGAGAQPGPTTATPTTTATATGSPPPVPTPTVTPTTQRGLVVNTTDDTDDGTCDAAHCSLREALAAAGGHPGADLVTFAIPTTDAGYDAATGVWTIEPAAGFTVSADTTVDGSIPATGVNALAPTRPGIEIDGTTLAQLGLTGLGLGDGVTLRGLVVNHFQYSIWVGGSDVTIEGCYVGTDAAGTSAKPTGIDGILVAAGATGAVIQDNVLSGNNGSGIRMFGETTTGHTVRRNRIGTNAAGTAALPNGGFGIRLHAGAHHNSIGPDNLIAFNGWGGVQIDEAVTRANTISRNRIHGHSGPGIQLRSGGNDGLAAPVIATAGATQVTGTACSGCVIELFSDAGDEGAIYEGTTTANGAGQWAFAKPAGLAGINVTATATDGAGNTSAFSAPVSLLAAKVYLPLVLRSD